MSTERQCSPFGAPRCVLVAVAVALTVGACVPRVEPAGPPTAMPGLGNDHVRVADGTSLPLRVWRAEGETEAALIALHGFNDYSNAFATPARAWAAQGITTYAYDQRGFGRTEQRGLWPGADALVEDLRTVTRLAKAAHPEVPVYLLGESMGGAVVMTLMGRPEPPSVAGIVLVAPAVWGWQSMNPFYRAALWLGAHVMPWAKVSGRGLDIKPSDNLDMLKALAKDPNIIKRTRIDSVYGLVNLMDTAFAAAGRIAVPALVLYGEHDEIVPKEPTFDMLRSLEAPHRLAIYPDGYHMLLRDLEAAVVHADVVAWIEDRGAPLPSGHELDPERLLARK